MKALRRYICNQNDIGILEQAVQVTRPASSKEEERNCLHIMASELSEYCQEEKVGRIIAEAYRESFELMAISGGRPLQNQITRDGLAPIHVATMSNNRVAVEILLDQGASVNVATSPTERSWYPHTALDLAYKYDNEDIAYILEKYGTKTLMDYPPWWSNTGKGGASASSWDWRPGPSFKGGFGEGGKHDHKGKYFPAGLYRGNYKGY